MMNHYTFPNFLKISKYTVSRYQPTGSNTVSGYQPTGSNTVSRYQHTGSNTVAGYPYLIKMKSNITFYHSDSDINSLSNIVHSSYSGTIRTLKADRLYITAVAVLRTLEERVTPTLNLH